MNLVILSSKHNEKYLNLIYLLYPDFADTNPKVNMNYESILEPNYMLTYRKQGKARIKLRKKISEDKYETILSIAIFKSIGIVADRLQVCVCEESINIAKKYWNVL